MFKRVERKRKRREEDEELDLEATMGITDMNDTDSNESNSDLEPKSVRSDDLDASEDMDQTASDDEDVNANYPISVAEALKDPIYVVSLDPTIHGCVLCKGKLIKNTGMATAHRNANAHMRRVEHFRLISTNVDPHSNAWELVRAIRSTSNAQMVETQELSKRALKRQVKQTALREKRRRHKELKAKAIAKKASKKLSTVDKTDPTPSTVNLRGSGESQIQLGKAREKKKRKSIPTSTIGDPQDLSTKKTSPQKDSEKLVHKYKPKSTRKANRPS